MTPKKLQTRHMSTTSGVLLVIAGLLAGCLVVGALFYRAYVGANTRKAAAHTDLRLCHAIRHIIELANPAKIQPGDPGYAYYSTHPDELEKAKKSYSRTLGTLNCEHLPSVVITGALHGRPRLTVLVAVRPADR